MKFYVFIQNNEIIGAGQAKILSDNINVIEVTEEYYNMFITDRDTLAWDVENRQVIINPKYNEIKAQQREEEFNINFFKTSLGYIKRQVTMKDGYTTKDFITDLIPLMMDIPGVPIIVYDKPDFTQEITEQTLLNLQRIVVSTPELIKECKAQAIVDFYGYNPVEELLYPVEPEVQEPEVKEPEIQEPEVETLIEEDLTRESENDILEEKEGEEV